MNILVALAVLLGMSKAELFTVAEHEVLRVGLQLKQGKNTRMNISVYSSHNITPTVDLIDPTGEKIRTFEKEMNISLVFIPKLTGNYYLHAKNNASDKISLSLDLPETNEGPFADKLDNNKVKELEEQLKYIIDAQKSMLQRQSRHLEIAKSTKGWIRKLTVLEVVLCLFALYYVHSEAVKTFYSTRKI